MLERRVLTAVVLAPLFVLGVLHLSSLQFAMLAGLPVLVGAWEWTSLSGFADRKMKIAGLGAILVLMLAGFAYGEPAGELTLIAACIIWLAVAARIVARRESLLDWPGPVRWAAGAWVLVPAWLGLCILQQDARTAALMLLALIWSADTGAYFAGRRWGRRRLAPVISPGKTVEGVWGAVAAAMIVAGVFGVYWGLDGPHAAGLMLLSVAVVVVSVVGDLFESNWKRASNTKDSGSLLPGHGGVLDRIDSITAGAPFFALGWLWWFDSVGA